jgi:alpha-N-arabinofuranosidase
VNRSVDGPIEVTMDSSRTPVSGVLGALGVHDADRLAVNTADRPDRVAPHPNDSVLVEDGRVAITLPPVSWTALSLSTR